MSVVVQDWEQDAGRVGAEDLRRAVARRSRPGFDRQITICAPTR